MSHFIVENTQARSINPASFEASSTTTKKQRNTKRLVVELGEKTAQDLDALVEMEETNKTTVVNRAIQLMKLMRSIEANGGSVELHDPERGVTRLAVLR